MDWSAALWGFPALLAAVGIGVTQPPVDLKVCILNPSSVVQV